MLWLGLAIFVGLLVLAALVGRAIEVLGRDHPIERPVSDERRRIDREARKLVAPRGRLPHHCAGTDTCSHCAEMREAHRREELGIHFVGWGVHASRACSPTGTGDTTRRGW